MEDWQIVFAIVVPILAVVIPLLVHFNNVNRGAHTKIGENIDRVEENLRADARESEKGSTTTSTRFMATFDFCWIMPSARSRTVPPRIDPVWTRTTDADSATGRGSRLAPVTVHAAGVQALRPAYAGAEGSDAH